MEPNQYPPQATEPAPSPWVIPFSIVIAGALIGAGVYFSGTSPKSNLAGAAIPVIDSVTLREVNSEDHILGSPNATAIIVEFSDTECPFCKQFHSTMQSVMKEYGPEGKVAWVYRQFPISALHSRAQKEAEATECVADLGGNAKFWEYTNIIYTRTKSNDTLDPAALPSIAKEIGIDEGKFNECLSSGKMKSKVDEDIRDGTIAGVVGPNSGTPYSILVTRSGQKIVIKGAQSLATMKSVIDAALVEEGK